MPDFTQLILMIIPLLFAVTIHEVAHGYAAYRLGDPTAMMMGRLTLNPIKHLDPFGSLILPLMLKIMGSPFVFGYAKPVPVNFNRLRNYRNGVIIVSSAGVVINLLCAIISGIVFQLLVEFISVWYGNTVLKSLMIPILKMLQYSVLINLILAVFNLIPVPPLDGSKIVSMLLPPDLSIQYARLEPYGMIIIVILLMLNVVDVIFRLLVEPMAKLLIGV